jgi:GT2 family glycosyltransferase
MWPETSVFWLNFNSMHVIDIIKKSLDAIFQIDYPRVEFIIVDNGSTDGSEKVIEEYVKSKTIDEPRIKFIRLQKNFGFTGGINAAYRARDRRSKYVALINNDAIPKPSYLKKLIVFLEKHQNVGAVQGVVVKSSENSIIDSAGFLIDEALNLFSFRRDEHTNTILKPIYVSYVEGTMPVYNVEAVKRSLDDDKNMYITSGFMYYLEDVFLSLMLWNHAYKCVVLPQVAGEHYRMATTTKFSRTIRLSHYFLRNRIALLYMTNSRFRKFIILRDLRILVILRRGGLAERKSNLKTLIEGIKLGKELKRKHGMIDLNKVPMREISCRRLLAI